VFISYTRHDLSAVQQLERALQAHDVLVWRDQEGITLHRKQQKDIAETIAAGSHLLTIAGHTVPACNVPPPWASDAGHLLAQGHPFAACFWIDGEQLAVSLRSAPDGLDVSEIAKAFGGGGGHPHAAGFKVPWTGSRSIEP
jgi:nanoRNase/pAp phosphatase (c-di-AMP/oligoRNAs hydrolase)